MLNQQNPFINFIDSYIEPLVKRVLQTEKLGIFCDVIQLDSVLSSCGKAKGDRFKLSIPYAKENLVWNVFFDSQCPEMGPDFIFNDDTFLTDIDADTLATKVPSLAKWNPNDRNALFNVLMELLTCYKQHQIQLLARCGEKLQFEYHTLVNDRDIKAKDIEVILLPLGCKPTEARFLINLTIDTSLIPGSIHRSETDTAILVVTFYGPDWTRITSQLCLSPSLEQALGGMELPPFSPDTLLMDYVPTVKRFIDNKIKWLIQSFEKKRDFISSMLALYEPAVIEYDAVKHTFISLLLEENEFHFHLHIFLPPNFPKEKPVLTLQSVYHMTPQGESYIETFKSFPYQAKWDSTLMIEKITSFIMSVAAPVFQSNSLKNIV